MAVSRVRHLACAAAVAVVAVTVAPASAETEAHQDVNCDWGQSGSALFRENAANAAWEVSATYEVNRWWGEERHETDEDDGDGDLFYVSRGTYRVTYTPSSSNQRIVSIHVRSSGSVEAAGGQQCTTIHQQTRSTTVFPESPLDDIVAPPVVLPDPYSTDPVESAFAVVETVSDVADPITDLVYDLEVQYIDPIACPPLTILAGDYTAARIDGEGDVYAADGKVWDCPPYEPAP